MTSISWLQVVPSVLIVLFLAVAIVITMIKDCDRPARSYALSGLVILLLLRIARVLASLLIAHYASPGGFLLYHGIYSLFSSILYIFALGLLLAAALSRRSRPPADEASEPRTSPVISGNPYMPPSG